MSDALDFRFLVEDEDGNRNVVPISVGTMHIGRQADNEICLPERNVSRRHAKLTLAADGTCSLEDLNSYNGVLLNGQRIQKTGRFRPGDTLRIGDFQLELRSSARRTDGLVNTAKINLLAEEGTEPAGTAEALSNEPTVPGEAVSFASEPTDVSGRVSVQPAPASAQRSSPSSSVDEPTQPGREITDRHLLLDADGPNTLRDAPEDASSSTTQILPGPGRHKGNHRGAEAAQGPTAPFAHLLCLSGERAGTPFALNRLRMVIGRTDDNDITLNHRSISRQHSRMEWSPSGYRVVDLDSSNGTLVNDESYQQVELHGGDVVELGQIRLRYVLPGEACVLSADERAAVASELAGARVLTNSRWPLLVGVAGVACLVTAGVMVWTQKRMADPAVGEAPHEAPQPSRPPDEAESLVNQAEAAIASKNFGRAQALATAALAMDPTRHDAQQVVRQASDEERAARALQSAQGAVDSRAWADAFNALQDMPKDAGDRATAQALMAQIRPALLRERLDEAHAALEQNDLDEVALLIDEMDALQPDAEQMQQLRHALDAAKRRADTHKGGASKKGPSHPSLAPHKAQLLKPPHPAPPVRAQARPSEEAMAQAKAAYSDGTRLLASGQTQRAIDAFNRCVSADKTFSMCYRALGIAHAKAENGPKAVHFYRLYLKVDPQARDAAQVRQLLQQYNQQATQVGESK